jgi:proteasome accessory factor B
VERSERLVDLILSLVHAKAPLSLEQIREAFPGEYDGPNPESGRRKFERDKQDLLELGIPLRYVGADEEDDSEGGYVVDRDQLFLPDIQLDPEEMAVVYLAGLSLMQSKTFPYRDALAIALRKMELRGDSSKLRGALGSVQRVVIDQGERGAGPELDTLLQDLQRAIIQHKQITFAYHARYKDAVTIRVVDPYGLFHRQGRWSLVGYSHERAAIRVFLVHRMRDLSANAKRSATPDFEPPADFQLGDWTRTPAFRYDLGEPVVVELEVESDVAFLAEDAFGQPCVRGDAGWTQLRVETTNADAVIQWVLGMGPRARVTGPPEVRARIVEALESALRAHEAAS